MSFDILQDADPESLATFVTEYVRRQNEPDAATHAVIAAQLREARWLPHQIGEMLLARPEIQAAISVVQSAYKPRETKEVTLNTISTDMEVLYQEAKNARQFTAAIAAKKLQAELHGMLSKDININVKHSVSTMTDAELEKLARKKAIDDKTIDAEYTEVTVVSESAQS